MKKCSFLFLVFQPTLMRGTLPQKNGIPDLDYLAPDCFHFAQKTHALRKRLCEYFAEKNPNICIHYFQLHEDCGTIYCNQLDKSL